MIVVANRIYVADGQASAFEARFLERESTLEAVPGFVRNELLKPTLPEQPYVVVTHWRDRASFEAWTKSPAFRQAHANHPPREMFRAPNVLEIHEVLQSIPSPD